MKIGNSNLGDITKNKQGIYYAGKSKIGDINKFLTWLKTNKLSDESEYWKQLKMGIEVEKEHYPDLKLRQKIAEDHLDEIADYYTRLKKMEGEAMKKSCGAKTVGEEIKKQKKKGKKQKQAVAIALNKQREGEIGKSSMILHRHKGLLMKASNKVKSLIEDYRSNLNVLREVVNGYADYCKSVLMQTRDIEAKKRDLSNRKYSIHKLIDSLEKNIKENQKAMLEDRGSAEFSVYALQEIETLESYVCYVKDYFCDKMKNNPANEILLDLDSFSVVGNSYDRYGKIGY